MYGYAEQPVSSVYVVAPPRSGTSLLVELLGNSPDLRGPQPRAVEGDPRLALEVSALARREPDAHFVFLYRDPRETVSSMLDAWRSGRFVHSTPPPRWTGTPWSLLLVPGAEDLIGKPLAEVVARQWAIATTILLDDLESLPPERWSVTSYDRLLADPVAEVRRVASQAGLGWDDQAHRAMSGGRRDLDSPDPQQWLHNAAELDAVWSICDPVARRAHGLFAHPPATRPARPPTTTDVAAPDETEPDDRSGGFRSVYTANLPDLVHQLAVTVFVSTYQSGRLIAVRSDGEQINTHFRAFSMPMGVAVDQQRLALGTRMGVWEYRNQPAVAAKLHPEGTHDAAYLARNHHVTGEIQIHEVGYCHDELWVVATRFSCLATLDREHSFVPRWRPPFVSALAAEDRCHLNGMAIVDDEVRYVTAMDQTDSAGGWRERKATHGVVLDVASGEVVASGLSMPHSPRVHDGRLWVLSSGRGEVCTVDVETGAVEVVAKLPGFTRGLAFAGNFAFVGLSQVRESVFGGIPIADELDEDERLCGVWVLDARTGATAGFLRFEGIVQELFDVQVLAGLRWPEIAEPDSKLTASSFVLPEAAMAEVHVARP